LILLQISNKKTPRTYPWEFIPINIGFVII
jgi:hypothetical protein